MNATIIDAGVAAGLRAFDRVVADRERQYRTEFLLRERDVDETDAAMEAWRQEVGAHRAALAARLRRKLELFVSSSAT